MQLTILIMILKCFIVLPNAIFTRAIVIWVDGLLQNQDITLLDLQQSLLKMKMAAEFDLDTSQDSIQFYARAHWGKRKEVCLYSQPAETEVQRPDLSSRFMASRPPGWGRDTKAYIGFQSFRYCSRSNQRQPAPFRYDKNLSLEKHAAWLPDWRSGWVSLTRSGTSTTNGCSAKQNSPFHPFTMYTLPSPTRQKTPVKPSDPTHDPNGCNQGNTHKPTVQRGLTPSFLWFPRNPRTG